MGRSAAETATPLGGLTNHCHYLLPVVFQPFSSPVSPSLPLLQPCRKAGRGKGVYSYVIYKIEPQPSFEASQTKIKVFRHHLSKATNPFESNSCYGKCRSVHAKSSFCAL